MNPNIKTTILSVFVMFALLSVPVQAQVSTDQTNTPDSTRTNPSTTNSTTIVDATNLVDSDENITATDLAIEEPILLPDSGFYFFKNWGRSARLAFTFDPLKKVELGLKYADERLIEVKKLSEKASDPAIIEKAMQRYEKEKAKIESRILKVQDDPAKKEKLSLLLDKITDKEIKHQKLLDRLEKNTPEELKEKMEERKKNSLKRFTKILLSSDSPEDLEKRISRITNSQDGSNFKNFKNIEILKRIEENAPEEAKEALKLAQERSLLRLRSQMQDLSIEDKKRLEDYLNKSSGNPLRKAVILSSLDSDELSDEMRDIIEKSKENALNKAELRLSKISDDKKTKYLRFLEDGDLKNIEILSKLENNSDATTSAKLLNIKKKAMLKAKEDLKDPKNKYRFLRQVEEANNVEVFDILDDMEKEFGSEDRAILLEARAKAKDNILRKLSSADSEEERDRILQRLASDDSSYLDSFEKLIRNSSEEEKDRLEEIRERQLEKIEKRLENTKDPKRLERMKRKIESRAEMKRLIEETSEEEDEVKEPKDIIKDTRELFEKATDAKKELAEMLRESTNEDRAFNAAKKNLEVGSERLTKAQELFQKEEIRLARGQLTAALRIFKNGIRMLSFEPNEEGLRDTQSRSIPENSLRKKEIEDLRDKLEEDKEKSDEALVNPALEFKDRSR